MRQRPEFHRDELRVFCRSTDSAGKIRGHQENESRQQQYRRNEVEPDGRNIENRRYQPEFCVPFCDHDQAEEGNDAVSQFPAQIAFRCKPVSQRKCNNGYRVNAQKQYETYNQ